MDTIVAGLAGRSDCRIEVFADWDAWPAPVIRIWAIDRAWTPRAVHDAMLAGEPRIQINMEQGGLLINSHCLQPGDEHAVIKRLIDEFDQGQ